MLGLGIALALALGQTPSPQAADVTSAAPAASPAPANGAAAADGDIDVEALLRRAKNEYAYGNYEAAVEQLRALIYPMRLTSDEQVLEARKYLALSHYLLGKVTLASEEFQKLLYLSPDYQLDPYTIAPPVIELFELVREKMRPELDAIRQRQSDEKLRAPAQQGFRRTIETTITERSDFATLLPFGVGQFQNGEVGWGLAFLTAELTFLAVNIASYAWASSIGNYHTEEDRRLVTRLRIVQYASAAAFGLTWSLGVVDARLNFVPVVRAPPVVRDEPLDGSKVGGLLQLRIAF